MFSILSGGTRIIKKEKTLHEYTLQRDLRNTLPSVSDKSNFKENQPIFVYLKIKKIFPPVATRGHTTSTSPSHPQLVPGNLSIDIKKTSKSIFISCHHIFFNPLCNCV